MGKGEIFGKIALVLGFLAFELFMLTMPFGQYRVSGGDWSADERSCDDPKAADDAVLAFLLITFFLLLGSSILLLLMNFSGMGDSKIIMIITFLALLTAAVFGIIGVCVYEACNRPKSNTSGKSLDPFATTTYISAAGFALISGIFLIVQMCCG